MNTDIRPEMPTAGERWRHFKGELYEIAGLANHSETMELLVLYRKCGPASTVTWARPLSMFMDWHNSGTWRFEREPEKPAVPLSALVKRFDPCVPLLDTINAMLAEGEAADGEASVTR